MCPLLSLQMEMARSHACRARLSVHGPRLSRALRLYCVWDLWVLFIVANPLSGAPTCPINKLQRASKNIFDNGYRF